MKTIYQARKLVKDNYLKNVNVKIKGLRNKIENYNGIISECYDNVFIVNTKNGKKSFTYTDVLVGNIVINEKKS